MELVHEEEVIDILEPGEAFGHPSSSAAWRRAFTVRAHEDSTCYFVQRDLAIEALSSPAGTGLARLVAGGKRKLYDRWRNPQRLQ